MEHFADAVAAVFAHHRQVVTFGIGLNGVADIAQGCARLDLLDSLPHGFKRQLAQALGGNRAFANDEHSAVVAEPAVISDDGHVHIDDIALLQRLVVGDAVAHHMVDRGADIGRVGRHAWGLIAQAGRLGALLGHALGAQIVDLLGGDAGLDVRGDVVQHIRSKAACNTHAFNVFGSLQCDAHGVNYPIARLNMQGLWV